MLSTSTVNIIQLGMGFFFNFFAFNSQGFIEEPVIESSASRQNINVHAGYYRPRPEKRVQRPFYDIICTVGISVSRRFTIC
ncbi:hypothetical protein Y032_0030g2045 [Ancylostoma ceylanicum]|uniref:Uncharacterized protein n=1 Tax=Ancylostoma ceylanicum TaxID=53326 RepID=A0A016UPU8_9BILA|nr:hypothetical protein Y032_0030g2045 [Ancylostoma ceylanicum]